MPTNQDYKLSFTRRAYEPALAATESTAARAGGWRVSASLNAPGIMVSGPVWLEGLPENADDQAIGEAILKLYRLA